MVAPGVEPKQCGSGGPALSRHAKVSFFRKGHVRSTGFQKYLSCFPGVSCEVRTSALPVHSPPTEFQSPPGHQPSGPLAVLTRRLFVKGNGNLTRKLFPSLRIVLSN